MKIIIQTKLMDNLPYELIGIIINKLDLDIRTLLNYKKICKQIWLALNSNKCSHLYHFKYLKWYQLAKRGPAKHFIVRKSINHNNTFHDILLYVEYFDGVIDGPPRFKKKIKSGS